MPVRPIIGCVFPPKKLKFIVACEEYTRHGPGGIDVNLYHADSLQELLDELWDGEPSELPLEEFRDINGDGMDFYAIKEIQPDGKLSEDLLAPMDKGPFWLYCEDLAAGVVGPFTEREDAEAHREFLRQRGDAGIGYLYSSGDTAFTKSLPQDIMRIDPEEDKKEIG